MGGETKTYWLTRFSFQRSLGFLYLIAFLVAAHQFCPLLGEHGLLPVPEFLKQARFSDAPSLFFLHYSDRFFGILAGIGIALSLAAVIGLSDHFRTWFSMGIWSLLWILYLSIVNVGQTFYAFGWESMLLEAGFLAIWMGASKREAPVASIWLVRWMLFRVMFGAGLIKLRGDPCWRDLTCLFYHYETQPLPNPLSWYFFHLPGWVHKTGVVVNHIVEGIVPWGFLAPQPICAAAGVITIFFQGWLVLSGNFSWLSYLTIILCLSCFDDRFLARFLPIRPPMVQPRALLHNIALAVLVAMVAYLSLWPIRNMLSSEQVMNRSFNAYHLVDTYGAFGSITRDRVEIIIEGTSNDVITPETRWQEYEFKAKPGDVARRPPLVSPYHWRLDWLMWFAAMVPIWMHPWVLRLAEKLLEGDNATLKLLAYNPFPEASPKHIRMLLYRYHFTGPQERKRTGHWWSRELVGEYLRPVSLHPKQGETG